MSISSVNWKKLCITVTAYHTISCPYQPHLTIQASQISCRILKTAFSEYIYNIFLLISSFLAQTWGRQAQYGGGGEQKGLIFWWSGDKCLARGKRTSQIKTALKIKRILNLRQDFRFWIWIFRFKIYFRSKWTKQMK